VVPVSAVNYDVTGASSFPGPGKVSSALPGGWSFTLKNIGSSTGTSADWKVYLCANNFLAGGDFVLASGTENSLSASGSVNKTVTGTFPAVTPGSYYIIVQVSSADDTTPANNTLVTGPITLIAKDIDYVPSAVVPNPAFLVAGGPMNGTFDIVNTGGDDGGATVFWQVRASLGTTPSAGDYILDGASITGGLHAGLPATTITVNGTWPSTPASWHLIVVIVAVDDIDHTNDITATIPTFTTTNPPAPDYTVDAPSAVLPATGTVSALVSATPGGPYHFSIRNTSLNTGAQQIYWKVYASNDEILDASDVLIDSGNIPFLPGSGSSGNINFDGTWPSTGAYYHFIIVADAGDDTNPSNDNLISGPIEVPNIVTETENGDAVGPYPGTLANANDFGNLGLNQLLKVTGVTDGKNTYDTFKINVGAGSGTLEVKAVWATGTDAIDLYAWDETGLQGSAVDTTVNIEEIIWILPHTGAWYIAVKQITNPPTSGYAYSLYIRPLP
jgi:hypothetical protein